MCSYSAFGEYSCSNIEHFITSTTTPTITTSSTPITLATKNSMVCGNGLVMYNNKCYNIDDNNLNVVKYPVPKICNSGYRLYKNECVNISDSTDKMNPIVGKCQSLYLNYNGNCIYPQSVASCKVTDKNYNGSCYTCKSGKISTNLSYTCS